MEVTAQPPARLTKRTLKFLLPYLNSCSFNSSIEEDDGHTSASLMTHNSRIPTKGHGFMNKKYRPHQDPTMAGSASDSNEDSKLKRMESVTQRAFQQNYYDGTGVGGVSRKLSAVPLSRIRVDVKRCGAGRRYE